MRKQLAVVSALALALAFPLVGCSDSTTTDSTSDSTAETQESDFDAVEAYWGQWHGYVEITGESIYGTTGGTESMLDIYLEEDGTCTVEPVDAHADLLTDEGTWEGTETEITLHLSDRDITLTVDGDIASGDATDFDIADFDTIKFDFYG